MKRNEKYIIFGILSLIVIIGILKIWVQHTPIHIDMNGSVGKVFNSVSDCAHNQKRMYLVFEEYLGKYGKAPSGIDDLSSKINITCKTYFCTEANENNSGQFTYRLYPENYGKPDAVFIEDSVNEHPNTFMLRFRGIKPEVKTMGDGTIHLFNKGQVATIRVHDN